MNQKNLIHITTAIPNTHFFVYRKKEFPFNFEAFNFTSKFFSDYAEENRNSKYIQLLSHEEESNINISDESINTFIKYVQREAISIDDDNVLSLNYLGYKYQIDELIECTKRYITEHQSSLVLDILSREANQNDNIKDMSTYEEIVAENFLNYINDSRMLNLPIHTIYRILHKHKENDDQNKHKNKDDENDRIFDFLIKCIDKYGRSSSVLFGELEADETKSQYLNVLLNKYSKIFDFHFLNSNLMRMKYEQENENLLKSAKIANYQNEIIANLTKENKQLKKDQEDLEERIKRLEELDLDNRLGEVKDKADNAAPYEDHMKLKGRVNKLSKDMKEKLVLAEVKEPTKEEEIDKFRQELKDQKKIINELKTKLEIYEKEREKQTEINNDFEDQKKEIIKIKDEQNKQKKIVESNKKQLDSLNNDTIKKLVVEVENLKKEIGKQKDDSKQFKEKEESKNIQTISYDNIPSNRFNGILTKLGQGNAMNALSNQMVNITASSIRDSSDNIQPKNVLNYGDDKQVFESKIEPNSWLCIEFKNHRVNPSHYSIKTTNYGSKSNCIPRGWDIEGSNNYTNWNHLDSRRNEESIHDVATANTFEITDSTNKHNYYKYLRLIQKGKNTNNDDRLFFSSIEFFGKIKDH